MENERLGSEAGAGDEDPTRDAYAEGGSPVPAGRRGLRMLRRTGLVLLAVAAALQLAGVLLRDRLEGRRPVTAQAPPLSMEPAPLPAAPGPGSTERFGPDVREIQVDDPGAAAKAAGPSSASVPKTVLEPAASGGPVLDLGLHYSQKYLSETEGKLTALGLPHFRVESERRGRGVQLTIQGRSDAERQRARSALEKAGYLFRDAPGGPEAFFFLAQEARDAAAKLETEGLEVHLGPVKGTRPAWTVYAGPFTAEEAIRVQKRLNAEGLQTRLAEAPRR